MATYTIPNTAHQNANGGSITSITVPATTIGNLGILTFTYSPVTVSVSGGGTWARIGTNQSSSLDNTWFWTVFTSSVTTITFTSVTVACNCYIEVNSDVGWAASPLDVQDTTHAYTTSTSGVDIPSNNITPAATGEFIVVNCCDNSASPVPTYTAGTGFTTAVTEPGQTGNEPSNSLEWKTGGSGSQNGAYKVNNTGDDVVAQIAAFKPAAGGGPTGPTLRTVQSNLVW